MRSWKIFEFHYWGTLLQRMPSRVRTTRKCFAFLLVVRARKIQRPDWSTRLQSLPQGYISRQKRGTKLREMSTRNVRPRGGSHQFHQRLSGMPCRNVLAYRRAHQSHALQKLRARALERYAGRHERFRLPGLQGRTTQRKARLFLENGVYLVQSW